MKKLLIIAVILCSSLNIQAVVLCPEGQKNITPAGLLGGRCFTQEQIDNALSHLETAAESFGLTKPASVNNEQQALSYLYRAALILGYR